MTSPDFMVIGLQIGKLHRGRNPPNPAVLDSEKPDLFRVKVPLPIDSCCSISLVSKKHADLVSQNCPDLKFTKLATHLSVSVASAESELQALGMMRIPIVWENGEGGQGR